MVAAVVVSADTEADDVVPTKFVSGVILTSSPSSFTSPLPSFCMPFLFFFFFFFGGHFPVSISVLGENGLSCIAAMYPLRLNSEATYLANSVSLILHGVVEVDDDGIEANVEKEEGESATLLAAVELVFAPDDGRCFLFLVGISPPDFNDAAAFFSFTGATVLVGGGGIVVGDAVVGRLACGITL